MRYVHQEIVIIYIVVNGDRGKARQFWLDIRESGKDVGEQLAKTLPLLLGARWRVDAAHLVDDRAHCGGGDGRAAGGSGDS